MTRGAPVEARPPEALLRLLEESGASLSGGRPIQHGTQYKVSRGQEAVTLNLYSTGKALVQGKASPLRELLEGWRLSATGSGGTASGKAGGSVRRAAGSAPDATPRLGIDEAGKGEYLGPLVVAGARVLDGDKDRSLREIGVRDSKDLGPSQVRKMAAGVLEILGERNVRVHALEPAVYETQRAAAGSNVNRLLGRLDARIMRELEDEVEVMVVDSFGMKARSYLEPHVPSGVRLEVRPRAEDDLSVAAASILARARYLEEMDRLSAEVGFELPRGSTHVLPAARRVYRECGVEGLRKVAKVHFSTTRQVVSEAAYQRLVETAEDPTKEEER